MDDRTPDSDAGRETDSAARLKRNPESKEARLDRALEDSMDASDPPSSSQPVHNQPAPSSGYDPEHEAEIARQREQDGDEHGGDHSREAERQQDA